MPLFVTCFCGQTLQGRDEDAGRPARCPSCGSLVTLPPRDEIYSFLVEAVLCTIFCCLPFGIVALVKAAEVNAALARGDRERARAASESAKSWCIVAFGVALALFVIVVWTVLTASGPKGA
jgi:DNA-directed RNA polymerase subunit RPC12/RpoP